MYPEKQPKRSPTVQHKLISRFIVVGDIHKSRPNTSSTDRVGADDRSGAPTNPRDYADRIKLLNRHLSKEKETKLDFVVFNGDMLHSDYDSTIEPLSDLFFRDIDISVPVYPVYGNHDRSTAEEWLSVFGHPVNHYFVSGEYGHILLNSSSPSGGRQVCSQEDLDFLSNALTSLNNKKGVFVFCHIPRFSGMRENPSHDSPECTEILSLLKSQSNLVSVFNSHFHEEDRILERHNIKNCFTGHFAHYGLNYYGYRIVEIYDDGQVITKQVDVSNTRTRHLDTL